MDLTCHVGKGAGAHCPIYVSTTCLHPSHQFMEILENPNTQADMEWMIVNPSSLHEVCGQLGYITPSGDYQIKIETCEDAVDELLTKLSNDGPSLQTRRNLGMFQVIGKDLVPLLIAASNEYGKVIPKLVKLLSHLTSPVECLLPSNFVSTEEGKEVAYQMDLILRATKLVFTDFRATRAVVCYLKILTTKVDELTPDECEGVSDGLLLLRNILHIVHKDAGIQNQILWNLFAHSLDKILLHLMTCSQKNKWGIALVQLIALIYKDQHVSNLQKLLNEWLDNSMSESSEDNESNTSPPDQAANRGDSSSDPALTSDPTSDSSDTGVRTSKCSTGNSTTLKTAAGTVDINNSNNGGTGGEQKCSSPTPPSSGTTNGTSNPSTRMPATSPVIKEPSQPPPHKLYTKAKPKGKGKTGKDRMSDVDSGISSSHFSSEITHSNMDDQTRMDAQPPPARAHTTGNTKQESYSQQQEGNSTSSNEDDPQQPMMTMMAKQRPIKLSTHAKTATKQRAQSMITISIQDKCEMRRKKLHKRKRRDKTSIKALVHHNPTDEDISLVLREFTVDFLLKGYGSLVSLLQDQLSGNASLQVDKSHFLWLITYFLKFASQIDLDFDLISPVLSNHMLSYLTYEGVAMCENLEICKEDLKPHLRRMHLVVTAIRELVHTVEVYSKHTTYTTDDKVHLNKLQSYMLHVDELRYLFLLLIRHFKPGVQSKQYLQDLITTNHVFLLLLEKISTYPEYEGQFKMSEFIKEFSSPLIMQQYGHLLEDFRKNGEFVNDCVFTMMHHIAGDLSRPDVLYQPLILKTFSNIWEVEFEIKDDFADLIEYVIQRFMKSSREDKRQIFKSGTSNTSDDNGWSKEDLNNLYWYYTRCATLSDPIGKIMDQYGGTFSGKSRESVLNQLLHQRIIGYNQFLKFLSSERMETGDSNGVATCDMMSTITSSSHATAGSSCPSVPTSVLMDHLRDANQSSFSFQTPEVEVEPDIVKIEDVDESTCGEPETIFKEDPEVDDVSASMSANRLSPSPNEDDYNRMDAPFPQPDSDQVPMDITDLDIALGELVNQISGEGQDLAWLQKQVLQACHVKFNFEKKRTGLKVQGNSKENGDGKETEDEREESQMDILGPVPYHYTCLGKSIPIVPWTHYQEILLMSPPYLLLLHKLGFHLPGDVGKLFPRIPHFWSSDVLLEVATKLGPIPSKGVLNFDLTRLIELMGLSKQAGELEVVGMNTADLAISGMMTPTNDDPHYNLPGIGVASSFVRGPASYPFGSVPHTVNWMELVNKSKQITSRNSDTGDSSSSSSCSSDECCEHMDDCASLKALPPTDHEDVTMMSEASAHEDDDEGDDEYDQADL